MFTKVPHDKPPENCFNCRHFSLTWELRFPYLCRAMGFKSRRMPSREVLEASGRPCLRFEAKAGARRKKI